MSYEACQYCKCAIVNTMHTPYCSSECRQDMRRRFPDIYYKDSPQHTVVCKVCGEEFKTRHTAKRICSKVCEKTQARKHALKNKKLTDFLVFERDNFQCIYCGKSSIEDGVKLEVEHVYPLKREGTSDVFNLVTACAICNGQKSAMLMSDNNILRVWEIIEQRNQEAGLEHFAALRIKFEKTHVIRKERLT